VLAIYGQASGPVPPFETARLIGAGYLTRTSLVHYARTPTDLRSLASEVLGLVESGALHVHIGGRYGLADGRATHEELESRRSTGKLILIP
jgi:NADPH:quinone reductase